MWVGTSRVWKNFMQENFGLIVRSLKYITSVEPSHPKLREYAVVTWPDLRLRWVKSRDSYRRIASVCYRCDSNR